MTVSAAAAGALVFWGILAFVPVPALRLDRAIGTELVVAGVSKTVDHLAVVSSLVATAVVAGLYRWWPTLRRSRVDGASTVPRSGPADERADGAVDGLLDRWTASVVGVLVVVAAAGVAHGIVPLSAVGGVAGFLLPPPSPALWVSVVAGALAVVGTVLARRGDVMEHVKPVRLFVERLLPLALALPVIRAGNWGANVTLAGWIAVSIVVAGAAAMQNRQLRLIPASQHASVSIGSVAVLATAALPPSPHPLSSVDPFHSGEQLVQWSQLLGGQLPFVDVIPLPSALPVVISVVAEVVFGDAVAAYSPAYGVVIGVIVFVIAASMSGRIGSLAPVAALGLVVLAAPLMDRVAVPLAYLSVVTSNLDRADRPGWVVRWALGSVATVALSPALGAAAVLATLPVLLPDVGRSLKAARSLTTARQVAFGVILIAASVVALPVATTVIGQARGGSLVWAKPLAGSDPVSLGMLFPLASQAGLLAVVAIAVVIGRRRPEWRAEAVIAALFVVASMPYAWGRVDYFGASRAGRLALGVFVVVVPLVAARYGGQRARWLASGALLATIGIMLPLSPASLLTSLTRPPPTIGEPPSALSQAAETWRTAADGGTVFDLSVRSGVAALADLQLTPPYPGHLYAATVEDQRAVVAALEEQPPAIAPVAPHSGTLLEFPPGLRSFRPYRWLLEHDYQLIARGPEVMFARPDRAADLLATAGFTIADDDARDLHLVPGSLGGLPLAWQDVPGQQVPAVLARATSNRFSVGANSDVPDLLRIQLACPSRRSDSTFITSASPSIATQFTAADGRLHLPVALDPDWFATEFDRWVEVRTECDVERATYLRRDP